MVDLMIKDQSGYKKEPNLCLTEYYIISGNQGIDAKENKRKKSLANKRPRPPFKHQKGKQGMIERSCLRVEVTMVTKYRNPYIHISKLYIDTANPGTTFIYIAMQVRYKLKHPFPLPPASQSSCPYKQTNTTLGMKLRN